VYVVLKRRTWIHSLLLLVSSAFWAALANITRVTIVSGISATQAVDLSTGWQHEMLGYSLVACGFVMLRCTDQLLCALLAPVTVHGVLHPNPLSRCWNWLIATPLSTERPPAKATGIETAATHLQLSKSLRLWTLGFFILGALQLAVLFVAGLAHPAAVFAEVSKDEAAEAFGETTLAEELGPWRLTDYRLHRRGSHSDFAEIGHNWLYQCDNRMAIISADYPFVGWHELLICYESRGWSVRHREVYARNEGAVSEDGFIEAELTRPTGESAVLQFSLFEWSGQALDPPTPGSELLGRRLLNRFSLNPLFSILGQQRVTSLLSPATVQIQQFVTSDNPVSDDERNELRTQFLELRRQLRQAWLRHDKG
jgi:exosortase/archaeosortase family protein